MVLQVILLFFFNFPLALFFLLFIILFFAGNIIFTCRLIRKYNKKKKTIEQIQTRLKEIIKNKNLVEKKAEEKDLFYIRYGTIYGMFIGSVRCRTGWNC